MYRERPSRVTGAIVWSWTATATSPGNRVLPDGCMDVMWREGRLFLAGPDTRAHEVHERAGVEYVGVRLAPGTGPSVAGVPADEIRDRRPLLADVWGSRRAREAEERVAGAPSVHRALEELAAGRIRENGPPDPVVAAVVAALADGERIAAVADRVGLSERQLHRRVVAAIGYGPKILGRVLRMNQALELARGGRSLADVAADAGYADQAHLSHDMKALTGRPLTAVLAGR
jgi:AraC-like DNA-binding protein